MEDSLSTPEGLAKAIDEVVSKVGGVQMDEPTRLADCHFVTTHYSQTCPLTASQFKKIWTAGRIGTDYVLVLGEESNGDMRAIALDTNQKCWSQIGPPTKSVGLVMSIVTSAYGNKLVVTYDLCVVMYRVGDLTGAPTLCSETSYLVNGPTKCGINQDGTKFAMLAERDCQVADERGMRVVCFATGGDKFEGTPAFNESGQFLSFSLSGQGIAILDVEREYAPRAVVRWMPSDDELVRYFATKSGVVQKEFSEPVVWCEIGADVKEFICATDHHFVVGNQHGKNVVYDTAGATAAISNADCYAFINAQGDVMMYDWENTLRVRLSAESVLRPTLVTTDCECPVCFDAKTWERGVSRGVLFMKNEGRELWSVDQWGRAQMAASL